MKIMGMDTSTIFLIVLLLLLAVIPARIAKSKGYSYGGFYAFGFFLFIPALIVALIIKPKHTAEDLVAYKKLLDEGVITQEEFDAKKNEVLNG
jgi:hypothetical protein